MCGGVQFALSQAPGLEAMMLFHNNDADNHQGAFYLMDWGGGGKENYQSSLGKVTSYV